MKPWRLTAPLLCVALAACEDIPTGRSEPAVEYRPEVAGTVDHAMCLLGFSAVKVRKTVTGHQLIDATLNGEAGTFLLDTGANASVVHEPYAERFGLSSQQGVAGVAIGLGGGMRASRSRIESLMIGGVEIRQRHLMVADLSQLQGLLGGLSKTSIHGIIGQDVITAHRAVIDAARPMLYLQPDGRAPAPAPASQCQAAGGRKVATQPEGGARSD